ncbi:MAG TPA: PAS domain S-box protein [Novimethylophilus sp.]|uniref:PAS domain S-box protein n=1 Tax=Novimethylophilus sp. TaxID=2137426 RepID=UPI002F426FEE
MVRSRFSHAEFLAIETLEEFQAALAQADFDLVVTEYRLGWSDGLSLLKILKVRFPCVPVIMVTAFGSEEVAVEGMKAGLADYLPKHQLHRLAAVVDRCLPRLGLRSHCMHGEHHVKICEKWDQAISRLTSDFAYSVRIEPDGKMVCEWVTEPYTRITGYEAKAAERIGTWLVPVHPDDHAVFRLRTENLLAGRQDISEYRIIADNGATLWLRDHALPVRDKSGERVVRIYGAVQDITRRRKAEEDLRLMRRALDSSNNGIIITGLAETDYPIIYANPAFSRITGYSAEELLGRNPRFLHGEDRDQPELGELRAALREGREGHSVLRNYRKDGTLFWNEVYIAPVTAEDGRATHYVGVQNDVTQRALMEAQLLKSETQIRSILENVLDGIITIDEWGVVESFNPAAEKIFGYTATEVIGRNVSMLMPEPDRSLHDGYLVNYQRTGERRIIGAGREVTGLKKDGKSFPMELGVSEIKSDQRRRIFIGVVHDLTDRKRVEETLRELSSHLQSAREGERTRIAREIHDELGSFLAALKMDISWLAKKLPEKALAQREKIGSMNRMIDEAIQTVRKIATDLRPSILDNLGLLAAMEWQVQEFCENTGIDCKLTKPASVDIDLDSERATAVFRILQEAITNITLHSGATQAQVEVQAAGGELVMKITDNGKGVGLRQLVSPQSLGILGMHERAHYFGGMVQIASQPGTGTTIIMRMPLNPAKTGEGT